VVLPVAGTSVVDAGPTPWGLPYRVVTKNMGGRTPLPPDLEVEIALALFPQLPEFAWSPLSSDPSGDAKLISRDELLLMASRLPGGKAPGPECVPNEVVSILAKGNPEMLLKLYNTCLVSGIFPDRWKRARLVLLHKGKDRPASEPSSYRPLSLLDGVGKLFERCILSRINDHLELADGVSHSQFGFRRGRSTVDAIRSVVREAERAEGGPTQDRDLCVLVALDVRNAFNSAPWTLIDASLRRMRLPVYLVRVLRSYMSGRTLIVGEDNGTSRSLNVTCGVPQGSVIGPALWNIFYDGLLRLDFPTGVRLVAFADDVALVITAHNADIAEQRGNPALESIGAWMMENGLEIAPHK